MSFPKKYKIRRSHAIAVGIALSVAASFIGLSSASADVTLPTPAGSATFVNANCLTDHVVVNGTDATPLGEDGVIYNVNFVLSSSRGQESMIADVAPSASFSLSSLPLAFGETVNFTLKAQLDTSTGEPQYVVIDSFTATRENCEPPPVTCQSDATGLTGSAVVVGDTVVYKASLPKKACADTWVANGDTYRVADTYDESGNFNASSTPQHFFPETRVNLVIKKGENMVTEVRKLPVSCWWVQVDTYTGNKIDIVGPGGHGAQFLGGGFKKLSSNKCEIQPPIDTEVTPTAPTSVDKCGTKDDTYTVPSTNGVDYLVGNKVVVAGTYPGTGSVTVVAKAKVGFMLNGTSTWTFGFTNVACEQPLVVTPPVTPPVVVTPPMIPPVVAPPVTPPTKVVVIVKRPTSLPVPSKVQTDGGELMSSETSGSGVLPFIVGFGFLIMGGRLTLKLRRREGRN